MLGNFRPFTWLAYVLYLQLVTQWCRKCLIHSDAYDWHQWNVAWILKKGYSSVIVIMLCVLKIFCQHLQWENLWYQGWNLVLRAWRAASNQNKQHLDEWPLIWLRKRQLHINIVLISHEAGAVDWVHCTCKTVSGAAQQWWSLLFHAVSCILCAQYWQRVALGSHFWHLGTSAQKPAFGFLGRRSSLTWLSANIWHEE